MAFRPQSPGEGRGVGADQFVVVVQLVPVDCRGRIAGRLRSAAVFAEEHRVVALRANHPDRARRLLVRRADLDVSCPDPSGVGTMLLQRATPPGPPGRRIAWWVCRAREAWAEMPLRV